LGVAAPLVNKGICRVVLLCLFFQVELAEAPGICTYAGPRLRCTPLRRKRSAPCFMVYQ